MTATSSSLRNRIEGFGSEPDPAPESSWWGSWSALQGSESSWGKDKRFEGFVSSAKAGLNSMLEAVDGTVNRVADRVDDVFDTIVGESDSMDGDDDANQRRTEGDAAQGEKKDGAKSSTVATDRDGEDDGTRSGMDWARKVSSLCEDGGDIEEFILVLRSQSKNEFEEKEVGGMLADQLLKEVKTDGVLRVLHIMQAMVSDGNLDHAIEEVRTRCAMKLKKLRASPLFGALAGDVGGPELDAKAAAASADASKAASDSKPAPAAAESLLDLSSQPSSATPAKQAGNEVDLLGLAPAAPVAAASSASSAAAAPQSGRKDFVPGQLVQAVWAGDGQRYPAVVERVTTDFVMVHWMRRAVISAPEEKFVCEVGDDSSHRSIPRENVSVTAKDAVLLDLDAGSTTEKAVLPSSATPSPAMPATSSTQSEVGSLPTTLFAPPASQVPSMASPPLMPQQPVVANAGFTPGCAQPAFGACAAGHGLGTAMPGAMGGAPMGATAAATGGGYLVGSSSSSARTTSFPQSMPVAGTAGGGMSMGYGISRTYGLGSSTANASSAAPDPFAGLGAWPPGATAKTGPQATSIAAPRRTAHAALQAANPETSSGGVSPLASDLALGDVFALSGVRPGTTSK